MQRKRLRSFAVNRKKAKFEVGKVRFIDLVESNTQFQFSILETNLFEPNKLALHFQIDRLIMELRVQKFVENYAVWERKTLFP